MVAAQTSYIGGDRQMQMRLKKAAEIVDERHKDSVLLDREAEDRIPRFDFEELALGKVLGRGGFCVVNEVSKLNLSNARENGKANELGTRAYMSEKAIRDGHARYAIKKLSKDVVDDPHRFVQGTIDLAVESRFLAVINHPNIIKMRAMGASSPFGSDFFLVLDRLFGTLEPKLKDWKKLASKYSGAIALMRPGWKKEKMNELTVDRLLIAYDLASAMRYMHSLNVIYRDLKPENIGFDVRGDVKIFDLGLAKEINPDTAVDGVYKLTGNTGSLRYMAPEISKNLPYNFSVDLYSFGIIFWQICSLNMPYQGYTCKMHAELVVEKGYRPKVEDSWPIAWSELCRNCWSKDMKQRPSFDEVCEILGEEISHFRGDGSGLRELDQSRKSTRSL